MALIRQLGAWRPRPTRQAWVAGVAGGALVTAAFLLAHRSSKSLLLSASDRRLDALHGTWHRMFAGHGLAGHAPVAVWILALVVVGLLGLPYVVVACAALPDRGFALARPIGLLLVGWVGWWLVCLHLVAFTRLAVAIAVAVVGLGGLLLAGLSGVRVWAELRARWQLILVEEAVFWALFAGALVIRYLNPDLWHPQRGGEKPMDLAYLLAVTKSTHFPPYDPWFAGGHMNYYYFGFLLVAVLVKATAIVPTVAYNLAIPSLVALLGAGAFGVGATLVRAGRAAPSLRARISCGLLATLFVVVVGNLGELRVVRTALHGSVPTDWWYWNASRLVHTPTGEPGLITEFPAFTYLYADLHAHAMALPFAVAALGLAGCIVLATANGDRVGGAVRLLLLSLVVGSLWAINSWDYPTYVVVSLVALTIAFMRTSRRGVAPIVALVGRCASFLALSYLLFLPFHLHYRSVFQGFERWHGSRTGLDDYLTIHGLFLFAIASALVVDLWTSTNLNGVARSLRLAVRMWDRTRRRRELVRALVRPSRAHRTGLIALGAVAVCAIAAFAARLDVTALALVLGATAALTLVRRRSPDVVQRFVAVLFLIGLCLTIAVEYFVARAIDIGRVNTVFKIYLQVWVLWALCAASSVLFVYERLTLLPRSVRVAWRAGLVVLVSAAALYPVLAIPKKIEDRFEPTAGHTLNGAAFMQKAVFETHGVSIPLRSDLAAITWIQSHIVGSPVIAEVNTDPDLYAWGDRYAMFTGNPTIVGWSYHERQQRPWQSAEVTQRIADVQLAYETTDPALAARVFRRYGARYVIVGPLERAYYPAGIAKWRAGEGRYWTTVYASDGVRILRLA